MHDLDKPHVFDSVIASLERQLGVGDIIRIGLGNEFHIFRADLPDGPAAVKVPKDRVFSNANDAYIDSHLLLGQEFALMRHARANGISQIPEPIAGIEVVGFGALVMSYVPTDDSMPDEHELGRLLATIHSVPLPDVKLSAQEGCEIPELIANRLHRRWKELASLTANLPGLPGSGVRPRFV